MKHCIAVKWNEKVTDKKKNLPEIRQIFGKLLKIDGIFGVEIKENIIDRPNRFDLLICIEMDKEILPIYDESVPHKEWKEKYSDFIDKKAIFDLEE